MRLLFFAKLMTVSLCIALLLFGLFSFSPIDALKALSIMIVISVAITYAYPQIRGIKKGDTVSVVNNSNIPAIIGRSGIAASDGRKNNKITIHLDNGAEVTGVIESYDGLISKPKIRILYEEKLVEQ